MTSYLRAAARSAALGPLLWGSVAQAQTSSASPDLTGSDEIVIASRSPDARPLDLLGSSATILDQRALETRQTRMVADVLRDVPGVAVSRGGAVGSFTQVRVRGAESNQVLVLVDGIKLDDPGQGEFDFGTLPADDAARIEVLRGQQSSLYGSDAIGGVISYSTLSGREAPGLRLRAEGGSQGTAAGAARLAGVAGALDYALSGTGQHIAGYPVAPGGRRNLASDLAALSGKANWRPSDRLRVAVVGRVNHAAGDTDDQGIPVAGAPIVGGRPVQVALDSPGTYYRNRGLYGLSRVELDSMSGAVTTALSGQIADTQRRGYSEGDRSSGDRGQRQRYSLENVLRLGSGRLQHRVTIAADAERESFRNTAPGPFVDRSRHRLQNYGLVGQYTLTAGDRLGFGASVRHDWNDFFRDATTWHVDGSYRLGAGTRVHAAAGTGIKDPGPYELFGFSDGAYIGNPSLRPELSRGWEAGIDQDFAAGAIRLGATYFSNRLHDEIYTTFAPPTFAATSLNRTTSSRQQGVELFAQARLASVRFDASYTYLHAPQSRDVLASPAATFPTPITAQAIRRAKHIGSVNVTYAPVERPYSATLTVRYNGRQRDVAFTQGFEGVYARLKAYTLVNLAATYHVGPAVELFARAENLAGERYQEVFGFRAPGRTGYGGVRLRF